MRYNDLSDADRAALDFYGGGGQTHKAAVGSTDCDFCGDPFEGHTGNKYSSRGCTSKPCGAPDGECAVYQSRLEADDNERWTRALDMPVLVTPQQVANRLHERRYGKGEEHLGIHSCSCHHEAMYYLGVEVNLRVYWPDGKGGNAWDPHGLDSANTGL